MARPLRVLIVDDEEAVRRVICRRFADRGHRVIEAATGEDAIARGLAEAFDAGLFDLSLPRLGGAATFVALRTEQPTLRGYGMSGKFLPDEGERRARESGMRGFFPKPFDIGAAIAAIEADAALIIDQANKQTNKQTNTHTRA